MAVDEEGFFPTRVDPFSEDVVELVDLNSEPQPLHFSREKFRAPLHSAFFVCGEFGKLS
jgi:hypothetical protein